MKTSSVFILFILSNPFPSLSASFLSPPCYVPGLSSFFLLLHLSALQATKAGSPPWVLCGVEAALPPRWPAHQQKAISHPEKEEDSCLTECGAWGASRGQAENGVVTKEEDAVFNGMEIN